MVTSYLKHAGRIFAHLILSGLLIYDIVGNNTPFGIDNAGLYAVLTLFPELVLAFFKFRSGNVSSNVLESDSDGDSDKRADSNAGTKLSKGKKPLRAKTRRRPF